MTWHRNDVLVSDKTVTVRDGVMRSELVIENLGRDDVRTVLTCNATNNNRSVPLSSSVLVKMNCKYTGGDVVEPSPVADSPRSVLRSLGNQCSRIVASSVGFAVNARQPPFCEHVENVVDCTVIVLAVGWDVFSRFVVLKVFSPRSLSSC